jgi:cobyrinic acid a,c-diamide synthase
VVAAPFKVGPDYIDPGLHAAACGRPSRNLDGWMCGEDRVKEGFARGCAGAELAVVEGVMGLYDGASGSMDTGSTAEIARWLGGSVILVVDARSQARSAAALVLGFTRFAPELEFGGIVFNRVGSSRHEALLREATESVPGLPPVLGCLPRDEEIIMPHRHLGLVTAADLQEREAIFARMADRVERHIDIDALLRRSQAKSEDWIPAANIISKDTPIAVARDEAFCFYYPENLEMLEEAGARLIPFSPLRDNDLPEGICGIYLGGGYPELHAEALARNASLRLRIREAAASGLPIYAECGGLMYLAEEIDGRPMCGVIPARAAMLPRRKALGYREVTFAADTPLGPAGSTMRGHEFHYSEMKVPAAVPRVFRLNRPGGEDLGFEGYRVDNVLGSYVHLHFGSRPEAARIWVAFCRNASSL